MAAHSLSLLGRIVPPGSNLPLERAAQLLRAALERTGADAGFVGAPSEGGKAIHVLRVTRDSPNFVKLAFPLDAPYPLAAAMRLRVPFFIPDNGRLACDHPGLTRLRVEDHACATIPLLADGDEIVGAVNLTFEEPHDFTREERVMIEAVAAACAAELRR